MAKKDVNYMEYCDSLQKVATCTYVRLICGEASVHPAVIVVVYYLKQTCMLNIAQEDKLKLKVHR